MEERNAPILYVGGSKGGVGKSKLSFALVDYLLERGRKVLLLETDTSNPDVHKAHKALEDENLICGEIDLDGVDGWVEMINQADQLPGHHLVVNSAARSGMGVRKHGGTLREALGELGRELIVFWLINRQRDSLEELRLFHQSFPEAIIHVCRNLYFGGPDKFTRYNESRVRASVENGGRTLDFPELGDRVADRMYSDRLSIRSALAAMPIGDRAELRRWRAACAAMFDEVFGGNHEG